MTKYATPFRKLSLVFVGFLFITMALACSPVFAFDGKEIVQKSEARYTGDDIATGLTMLLINAQEQIRKREYLLYEINSGPQEKKTLTKFRYPNDIRDTGTLVTEVAEKDDITYLYIPAAKKLRRVSSKSNSWVGSDLNFEDLQDLEIEHFVYNALRTDTFDQAECYVIEMKVIDPKDSTYSKQIRWIRKDNYFPVKVEYFDKKGELLKIMEQRDLILVSGAYHPNLIVSRNVQDNHRTELIRHWIVLNTNMKSNLVSTRHLEKSIEFYSHPANIKEVWQKDGSS